MKKANSVLVPTKESEKTVGLPVKNSTVAPAK
jgi:hypothetical protein